MATKPATLLLRTAHPGGFSIFLSRVYMKYTKKALSIEQQIDLLKSRGLIIDDVQKARHSLSQISYYRLRAYTYPFQNNNTQDHNFTRVLKFSEIIDLYVFDRKLRLFIFDAIEKIEIALRTKIIYEFSLSYGSHWYEDENLYRNRNFFEKNLISIRKEINHSNEIFIDHYKKKYSEPEYPPSWMSIEVISIGSLSKLYSNLKSGQEKKRIAKSFGLPTHIFLESWMHSFASLRNFCAHHSRIWNRRFTIKPKLPNNTQYDFIKDKSININKLYAQLCCIKYFVQIIDPSNSFSTDLKELLNTCSLIDMKEMGFPPNWKDEKIWNNM
jgi:abortive infection bacteriophage resistance protein